MNRTRTPERVGDILGRLPKLSPDADTGAEPRGGSAPTQPCSPGPDGAPPADAREPPDAPASRYDFDLGEFPLFRLNKLAAGRSGREPLRYEDAITGRDGRPVRRSWAVHPGASGFGGPSTQVLLFDLLQLYAEQGARGSQIQFGTLRSLLARRGDRNPSKRDYDRLRRDFDVLRGYDIHCVNAFWDSARLAYADMNWRLFGSVFYFKAGPGADAGGQPFGFIEVSSVFQAAAQSRGLYSLGFDRAFFYRLKPLEQRLAVYLAKQFTSQTLHRRFVRDLARVLPIEAGRDRDSRRILSGAAEGLLRAALPALGSFRLTPSANGEWLAEFRRGTAPADPYSVPRRPAEALGPALGDLVYRIVEAVGGEDDRVWWARCAERLGRGAVDRGLGLLKEARRNGAVKNPGGLLTKFFKDIAAKVGVALTRRTPQVVPARGSRATTCYSRPVDLLNGPSTRL